MRMIFDEYFVDPLSIPNGVDLCRYGDRMIELIRVGSAGLTERRRWIKENIDNEYFICHARLFIDDQFEKRAWGRGTFAIFADKTDAMAFKLTWL